LPEGALKTEETFEIHGLTHSEALIGSVVLLLLPIVSVGQNSLLPVLYELWDRPILSSILHGQILLGDLVIECFPFGSMDVELGVI